jgi:hypothetical protein
MWSYSNLLILMTMLMTSESPTYFDLIREEGSLWLCDLAGPVLTSYI